MGFLNDIADYGSNKLAEAERQSFGVPAPFNKTYIYNIDASNWYKTFPFAFQIDDLSDGKDDMVCRFFLPIPPQNYTIQDMSASEAHATIGGVVEEINAQVFSMVTLVGTTGLSINNPTLGDGTSENLNFNVNQRKTIDNLSGRDNIARRLITDTINGGLSLIPGSEPVLPYHDAGSAVNTPKEADSVIEEFAKDVNNDIQSESLGSKFLNYINPFNSSEIPSNEFTNGWAWSQALRQFFLIFQRERTNNPNLVLYFTDYKSRTSYRCVPRSVQFQQNANAPYLINYTIILKCWALEDANNEGGGIKAIDRFKTDLSDISNISATQIISQVGKTCNTLNRFPSVAGSFLRNSTGSFL